MPRRKPTASARRPKNNAGRVRRPTATASPRISSSAIYRRSCVCCNLVAGRRTRRPDRSVLVADRIPMLPPKVFWDVIGASSNPDEDEFLSALHRHLVTLSPDEILGFHA